MTIETLFSSPDFKKMVLEMEITNIAEKPLDFFEKASSQMISDLLDKSKKAETRLAELTPQLSDHIRGGEESDGILTAKDEELFREIVTCNSEQNLSIEYAKVLSEMKVVYLFKTVEIIIKSLIHTAYLETGTKKFYIWKNMENYFNNIGIKISNLDGYTELTELRELNNNIKHSERINDDIENFYNRIKPKIQNFVKSLGKAIIEDLDEKI